MPKFQFPALEYPPPPFDPTTQTDYQGWYEIINSIVTFVTASTNLVSTLKNIPDNLEILEDDLETFNLEDFPWFLEVLSQESVKLQRVTETALSVQFPLDEVSHGEPNTIPRTICLVDTKDFGDVEYPIVTETSSFQDYTDSDQTLDSENMQENFEDLEGELPVILYDRNKVHQDLVLECSVDEIIVVQDQNVSKTPVESREQSANTTNHTMDISTKITEELKKIIAESRESTGGQITAHNFSSEVKTVKNTASGDIYKPVTLDRKTFCDSISPKVKNRLTILTPKTEKHLQKPEDKQQYKVTKTSSDTHSIESNLKIHLTARTSFNKAREVKEEPKKVKGFQKRLPLHQVAYGQLAKNSYSANTTTKRQLDPETKKVKTVKSPLEINLHKKRPQPGNTSTKKLAAPRKKQDFISKNINHCIKQKKNDSLPSNIRNETVPKRPETASNYYKSKPVLIPLLQPLEAFPKIKSCFKSGVPKAFETPKICVIKENEPLPAKRPSSSAPVYTSFKVFPKLQVIKESTLKLSAAETVKKAAALLKDAEVKVLRPTAAVKERVSSGISRPSSGKSRKGVS